MKKVFFFQLIQIILGIILFNSCRKDISCDGCRDGNRSPTAVAGSDQVITLPTDSVSLNGSSSSDPDGKISEWLWTKISGPASFNIIKQSDSITLVKALVTGTYQFELKVKDNGGLFGKDTVQITVNDRVNPNHPPTANAGVDQTITLPTNTINLDGSGSTDPDNNINGYLWTKISGPSSFNILNSNIAQTSVNNLTEGVYQFELKVTDAVGMYSRDTMRVNVIDQSPPPPPPSIICDPLNRTIINVQLISLGTLSQNHVGGSIAAVGGKILISGGEYGGGSSSRVDIYDLNSNSWGTAELSESRYSMSAVGAGNKIFFAGGEHDDASGAHFVSIVDIYDVVSGTWSTAQLSETRQEIVTAILGNKVFFAGGFNDSGIGSNSKTVDIYDLSTNTWSTSQLSEPRVGLSATTLANKVYFSGGFNGSSNTSISNVVDIYDGVTNTWSVSTMSMPSALHASIAIQNKIYWAGGSTNSGVTCNVEIKDIVSQTSSFANLAQPNYSWNTWAFAKSDQIVFFPGWHDNNFQYSYFDILNTSTNVWSVGLLPKSINYPLTISFNNIIYTTDGNKLWKLDF